MKLKNVKLNIDNRSLKQYKNIFKSFLFKGVSIISSFAIFPILLSYLSQENYGIWLAIYSIVAWTIFFDFGLGNGIKNKLIEALALKNHSEARKIVSTGYIMLFLILIGLVTVVSLLQIFIDWNAILKIKNKQININFLVYISFISFALRVFLDLINLVLTAHQKVSYTNLISCISNVSVFIVVFLIARFNLINSSNRLFAVGIIVSFIPVFILVVYTFFLFFGEFKYLAPSIKLFDKIYIKDITSKGTQFFVIQIAALVIFSTDNLIIARLFSSSEVTIYNIAYKFFSIFTIFWGIILAPYWAAFGEAYMLSDYSWIRKTVNNLLRLWLVMQLVVIISLFVINHIYRVWVGNKIIIPFNLSLYMALYICLSTYCNIFALFLNGLGKIRLQLYTSIMAAAINIPLAIALAKNSIFELSGIILATSFSLSIGAIFQTIQYRKIITQKANGIWNM